MKYVVILGDGMADYPLAELSNKTPLEYADKPNMDFLAKNGKMGLAKTVPDGMAPGSDVANLCVMGYDPKKYYTGRSPLEAVSMGISMTDTDVALRCNLVCLSDEDKYDDKTMIDYSSDEITTTEADSLICAVNESLQNEHHEFHRGISYRHCMIWHEGMTGLSLTPPHDITGKKIKDYLPSTKDNSFILELMKKSNEILKNHPINVKRIEKGLRPANSIWLWGEGKKPNLDSYEKMFGVKGSMISAVDLLKGIGICAGLSIVDVEGASGNIHTNFKGKANAAINELSNGKDFVFIHIEAPDECGHRGEIQNKVKAIELIDKEIIGPVIEALSKLGEYRILVMPDHPTPLSLKTHTSDPVPFIIYASNCECNNQLFNHRSGFTYTESNAKKTGILYENGHDLMKEFLKR